MILNVLPYRYLHSLCCHYSSFAIFETCIDSLRYTIMLLSPIRSCCQVFIWTTQLSYSLSVQILPNPSSFCPQHTISTPTKSEQCLIFESSWYFGLTVLKAPLLQASPLLYFQLFNVLLPKTNSPHSPAFHTCKSWCSFTSIWKSELTFQHILPLGRKFDIFSKTLTSSTMLSFLCLHAVNSFCFSLMTDTVLTPFVGQEVLRADFYFCLCHDLLSEFWQITLTFSPSDLLRW